MVYNHGIGCAPRHRPISSCWRRDVQQWATAPSPWQNGAPGPVCRTRSVAAHLWLTSDVHSKLTFIFTHTHPFNGPFSGTTQVSHRYQKGKRNWILLKQEAVSGSGISCAIRWLVGVESAPCSKQITTPAPHHSVFTVRIPFLPPNHQCQSTEGTAGHFYIQCYY